MFNFNNQLNSDNLGNSINIYHAGYEKCLPGHSFGPAIRQHYLFHYIISGKGYYHSKDKSYELQKNQGFLICPGESTYYKADSKEPWEYCWISFDGYEIKYILMQCGLSEKNLTLTDTSNGEFKNQLLSLIDFYQNNNNNELLLKGKFYNCFSTVCDIKPMKQAEDSKIYLEKALGYIHNNFSYDIKISEVANYIGIDRTYLYKLFVQNIKVSPQEYLISFRIKTALNLLENTQMNITEIAYSCGFKDTPTFCKHIKNRFKVSPMQYRKNKKSFILL